MKPLNDPLLVPGRVVKDALGGELARLADVLAIVAKDQERVKEIVKRLSTMLICPRCERTVLAAQAPETGVCPRGCDAWLVRAPTPPVERASDDDDDDDDEPLLLRPVEHEDEAPDADGGTWPMGPSRWSAGHSATEQLEDDAERRAEDFPPPGRRRGGRLDGVPIRDMPRKRTGRLL